MSTVPQSAIDNWPPPRPPWRFDVPAIPAHVTAVQDDDGDLYVRHADNPDRWSRWLAALGDHARITVSTKGLLFALPLVECEDPRSTS